MCVRLCITYICNDHNHSWKWGVQCNETSWGLKKNPSGSRMWRRFMSDETGEREKVLKQQLRHSVSTSGCFSSAPFGRICATTPENFSDRVTSRHVAVHDLNKRVEIARKGWKTASEFSRRHQHEQCLKIKDEMLQNMALYFWKEQRFSQICTFLFPSLQTQAVLFPSFLGLLLLQRALFSRTVHFADDEGKDHVETNLKRQINKFYHSRNRLGIKLLQTNMLLNFTRAPSSGQALFYTPF